MPAAVAPASREIAYGAAEIRAVHGARIRLPDALVIATRLVLGAERILTTDAGWPAVDVPVEVVRGA